MYSKELLKGTLSAIILGLLSDGQKMYGYEIFSKVKDLSDGKILLKDGSLYPLLQRMRKDGLLSYQEEFIGKRVRKYYYLTPKGNTERTRHLNELSDFIQTIQQVVFKPLHIA